MTIKNKLVKFDENVYKNIFIKNKAEQNYQRFH